MTQAYNPAPQERMRQEDLEFKANLKNSRNLPTTKTKQKGALKKMMNRSCLSNTSTSSCSPSSAKKRGQVRRSSHYRFYKADTHKSTETAYKSY